MVRFLKLINDEKKQLVLKNAKACFAGNDYATCTANALDICKGYDYAACWGTAVDYCESNIDSVACGPTGVDG